MTAFDNEQKLVAIRRLFHLVLAKSPHKIYVKPLKSCCQRTWELDVDSELGMKTDAGYIEICIMAVVGDDEPLSGVELFLMLIFLKREELTMRKSEWFWPAAFEANFRHRPHKKRE